MIIYLILCLITLKGYVGQTTTTLEHRWSQHQQGSLVIDKAIRKYGPENFEVSVLAEAHTLDELNALEEYHIKVQSTLAPNGYNLMGGGRNYPRSAQTRAKMSLAQKGNKKGLGRKKTPEERAKITASLTGKPHPHKGFKHTPESKAKISASRRGIR